MLLEILEGVEHRTSFKQSDIHAEVREDLGRSSTTRARPDHDDVSGWARPDDLKHPQIILTTIDNGDGPVVSQRFVITVGVVRSRGLEPPRGLPTCTSSMRVCQFRHDRVIAKPLGTN